MDSSFPRDIEGVRKRDPDAERRLVEHFWQTARRVAASRVSERLRARVDISDVACDALRSALSEVRNHRVLPRERKEFEQLVVLKAWSRAGDRVKEQLGQKRDARRDVPIGNVEPTDKATPSAESLLRGEELAKQMGAVIWSELDPLKAHAVSLVLISFWKYVEVSDFFRHELGINMSPGAIRAVAQVIRPKLISALGLDRETND